MKRFFWNILIIHLFLFIICFDLTTSAQNIKCVVIDAGHGGKDPGAVGKNSKEKDIVLALALQLGNQIESYYNNEVKVIYTRTTDEFIELYQRAKIANNAKADLFISIHCNSSKSNEPSGSETFVMGLHKSQANLEVAKKENSSILYEDDYQKRYDGYDPNSPEATIIFTLYQNIFLTQSLFFATKIQQGFVKNFKSLDRGVKQAGFLVLYNVTMPGVLVEAGFLSNVKEEELLNSEKGRHIISYSIFEAFKAYKESKEGLSENKSNIRLDSLFVDDDKNSLQKDTLKYIDRPIFRVQFMTSPKDKSLKSKEFTDIENVWKYNDGNTYKYTAGIYTTFQEANKKQEEMKKKGYKDAFVVVFSKDKRISISDAKKLLNNN